ncbi:MAG: NAD(P)/FAD-dependent oxidoreductase [Actinomycetota bacterium]|nr:NAD(P)/FAD-dependent oxidoreductase [Actinomycetota bacterium]
MTSAVVVGSGPNGLAAAVRLAQAGVSVTVLESGDRPGGGTRTTEYGHPGVLHDDCSAFHPTGVVSPFLKSLPLQDFGLEWLWPELDLVHPLDDGRAGVISRDMDRTAASLGGDAARWRRLFEPMVRTIGDLIGEVFQPAMHLPSHPIALTRFGINALLPATVTVRRWKDDPARALYMGVAAHVFGKLTTPLSGSVGLMLTAVGHAAGWPVAKGGSQAISTSLVGLLESLGGKVMTGVTVESLDQLREVTGSAPDIVMLDTAPEGVLRIVGTRLPERIRRAFTRYTYGPATYKVDFAIRGDIPWTNEDARRGGTIHLGGTAEQIVAVEAATVRGELPDQPFMLVGQQYLADPSRSADGLNPIWSYAHVPHGYPGDATQTVINQIERFAPGFRDTIVETHVRNVPQMAAYNANYVGGDIGAGANTFSQIAFRPRPALNPYTVGVPGVYLCSAATPPGPGVHGMGGFNAAETALARL